MILDDVVSSESSQCDEVQVVTVEAVDDVSVQVVSPLLEAEENGGRDLLEGDGDGGFSTIPVCRTSSKRGSLCVRLSDADTTDAARLARLLGL